MIALLTAQVAATAETDFSALSQAIATCDRKSVIDTVSQEDHRHATFLLDSYAEQRAIVAERATLAARRLKLHTPLSKEEKAVAKADKNAAELDSEAALALATEALDDRQHALDDARTLDKLRQDMLGYFRTSYLKTCQGRGK